MIPCAVRFSDTPDGPMVGCVLIDGHDGKHSTRLPVIKHHPDVPKHVFVNEFSPDDTCDYEWDWPLKDGSVSRTRCRSDRQMHEDLGWTEGNFAAIGLAAKRRIGA